MNTQPAGFQRLVIVVNPSSSNYDRGQRYIHELTSIFPAKQLIIIELRQSDYDRPSWLISRLSQALRGSRCLLAIAGGDGTDNLIIEALLNSPAISPLARGTVILPLWAGNANDLAHMINGNPPSSIQSLLETATVHYVHPLEVTLLNRGKTTTRLAACYMSVGASAYASMRISNPAHRRRRLYRFPGGRNLTDVASVSRAFLGAPTFSATIDDFKRPIYDIAAINGPRIAKLSRIPISLTDQRFYEIIVGRRHPLLLSYIVQIARGASVQRGPTDRLSFRVNEPTWAQINGEPLRIPAHTTITIRPHTQAFSILSTKLAPKGQA